MIVDDERGARRALRRALEDDGRLQLLVDCDDGDEAIDRIARDRPDILFLDVEMPGIDGFSVLERIGDEHAPLVIFVTAFDHYAARAFEARAQDYVLKPIDRERLRMVVDRALSAIDQRQGTATLAALRELVEDLRAERMASAGGKRLAVREQQTVSLIEHDAVEWLESAGNYVVIHVRERRHIMRGSLARVIAELAPIEFLQIRRNVAVRLTAVRELHAMFRGEYQIVLESGARVQSSRRYRKELHRLLGNA